VGNCELGIRNSELGIRNDGGAWIRPGTSWGALAETSPVRRRCLASSREARSERREPQRSRGKNAGAARRPQLITQNSVLGYHDRVATIDDDALVLDHHHYRDRHLILAVLTRASGVHRGVLRRARGGKAPPAAAAQVLSHVHVSLFQRPHAELADFRRIELVTSSFPLSRDLATSAAGSVVAELLATFCPLGEPAEKSFRLGVAALDALLSGAAANVVVAYVQYWVLALGGVLADPETNALEVGTTGARFLEACRSRRVGEVSGPVPPAAARWLDQRVRDEAERPLRALTFLRTMAE